MRTLVTWSAASLTDIGDSTANCIPLLQDAGITGDITTGKIGFNDVAFNG